jgi:hypothetical protein
MGERLASLLAAYGLEVSDVEPAALARVRDPDTDEEGLRRVVRLAATNRELRRVGLPPLLIEGSEKEEEAVDDTRLRRAAEAQTTRQVYDAKEREAIEACGLTVQQFDQTLRGTHGVVVGLPLNEKAYTGAWMACRSKAACACGDDAEAVATYMRVYLRRLAERMLGGPNPKPAHLKRDRSKRKKGERKKKRHALSTLSEEEDEEEDEPTKQTKQKKEDGDE